MAWEMDFEEPVPDWIPTPVLARYEAEARRTVRRSRRGMVAAVLTSSDVWWATMVVFAGLVTLGTLLGGIVLAVVTWPWVGLVIVLPGVTLLVVSFAIAAGTRHRWKTWSLT